MLVAESSETVNCQCQTCKAVRLFLEDRARFVTILSCSRIERRHVHAMLTSKDVSVEHHQGGGLLLKKVPTHPHCSEQIPADQFFTVVGEQRE